MFCFLTYILFCSFGCYIIADRKNYSKSLAVIWGILGGFIAMLIYLILPLKIVKKTPYLKSINKKRFK